MAANIEIQETPAEPGEVKNLSSPTIPWDVKHNNALIFGSPFIFPSQFILSTRFSQKIQYSPEVKDQLITFSSSAQITPHDIKTEKCGMLRVYVQGELDGKDGKVVFLTVHDLGSNHKSILKFVDHPSMLQICSRLVKGPKLTDKSPSAGNWLSSKMLSWCKPFPTKEF